MRNNTLTYPRLLVLKQIFIWFALYLNTKHHVLLPINFRRPCLYRIFCIKRDMSLQDFLFSKRHLFTGFSLLKERDDSRSVLMDVVVICTVLCTTEYCLDTIQQLEVNGFYIHHITILYIVHCIMYILQCAVYTVQCTVHTYSIHYTVCIMHGTLYTVQSTLYRIR